MKKAYHLLLHMVLFGGLIAPSYAQGPIYIGKIDDVAATYKKKAQAAANNTADIEAQLSHSLPGILLKLKLNSSKQEGNGNLFFGEVYNSPYSSFYLKIVGQQASGSIFMRERKKFYRYSSSPDSLVYLTEEDIDKVLCVGFQEQNTISSFTSQTNTTATTIPVLESLPGASAVVYLDFDGQTVTGTQWNSTFNSGNPIVADPANISGSNMVEIWKLISEDYKPFALNVTTSEAVFNSAPIDRRMRVIFTPTNYWYPNAGGVAYIGSFAWGSTSNGEHPCWVFDTDIKGAGDGGSHEVGHTLHLVHDGRTSPYEEYFQGQGSWAPIMGIGYYKPVVQWSKGEYQYANNLEDDLFKITNMNGFGYRPDDHGDEIATATPLVVDANGNVSADINKGIISTQTDIDIFYFTTNGGTIALAVNPNSDYPNLDIGLTLRNESNAIVAISDQSNQAASLNAKLAAGTYYLAVNGVKGDLGADSDFASLGAYSISTIPYCVPVYTTGCSADDFINSFTFNALVNDNSGCNNGTAKGYTNYAPAGTFTTSVNRGESYSISMQSGSSYPQGFGVWIDYNGDKDFDDAGEFVYASPSVAKSIFTTTITIPPTATLGATRLRVRCKYNSTITSAEPCTLMSWGEAEDYTITIGANQPPTVSITSPASGATFTAPTTISITVTAVDQGGSIAKVEFFQGTTKLGEDLTAPYEYSWIGAAAGSYTLTAKATDNLGSATTSAPVSVMVSNNSAPTVSITSPPNGTTFTAPTTISITAAAADQDGSIAKVEFFQGTTKLGEDLTAPYEYSWSGVAAGNYSITAKASDNAGLSTTSAAVLIMVNYCVPAYTSGCSADDFINTFSFNTLANNSGCSNGTAKGYTNYAPAGTFTTSVNRGQSYSMSMQSGKKRSQGFGVWIDYNGDKDFDDAGEFVYASPIVAKSLFTTTITIPATATLGATRLRVRCKYNSTITSAEPCTSMSWGEAEDYTIAISSTSASAPTVNNTSPAIINMAPKTDDAVGPVLRIKALPNPTIACFTLILQSDKVESMDVKVIDAVGRLIEMRSKVASNSSLTIGDKYRPGIYYVEIVQGSERVILKLIKGAD
ncbi:T9SS type A sorting domain-containing protein [Segetibacter sp. 3557_3]|uniref:GEVED domain-containing protein n=1 Tax=Segetibacter sp. 3557_3 TaxID=2547429 RepID=UPI0010589904|nr:GEVED domain-containing protein [Segetibacter sp. 3557_3]TDH26763.1 T9SS type A sorting domain-containing protein [Segetibacter sp. 3557_3]